MVNFKHGIYQIWLAIDQLLNVFIGNPFSTQTWADETWSSRCGRLGHRQPYKAWRVFIDALFYPFQGPNHCVNAYKKEKLRLHAPPESRSGVANAE